MKIRIKFRKYGVMKFIGHLDMMRYFQKAMRRAEIDIAYSEGFSPHQIMSFAAPLGVGITSDGEYLDIEVHSTRSSIESVKALMIPWWKVLKSYLTGCCQSMPKQRCPLLQQRTITYFIRIKEIVHSLWMN